MRSIYPDPELMLSHSDLFSHVLACLVPLLDTFSSPDADLSFKLVTAAQVTTLADLYFSATGTLDSPSSSYLVGLVEEMNSAVSEEMPCQ